MPRRQLCEQQAARLVNPLYHAINSIYVQVSKYYRKTRGEGRAALDVSQFFRNRQEHYLHFREFWDAGEAAPRKAFSGWLGKIQEAVASFEE
jgi:hypothetical protein